MNRNDAQRILDNPAAFTAAEYAEAWRAINLPGEKRFHGLRTGDMMQIDDEGERPGIAAALVVIWAVGFLAAAAGYTIWAMLP